MVSNASAQLFPDNTLSSFTHILPEQLNLEGQMEVAISKVSHPSLYQNVTEGKLMLSDKNFSNSSEINYLEPGFFASLTDIVEALNTLISARHNQSESCISVKVSQRKQKIEVYIANEGSGLAFFDTGLGHIFGSNVGNESGVMLRGKGPHKTEFVYDIVRRHSLMTHTDLIEYIIVGDTKFPLLRFFLFFSKPEPL